MTSLLAPPKRPCGSCPYRRDVPSGIWAAEEYAKLPAYDGPTWAQPPALFMCHQQDGCLCGGWLAAHDREQLLTLRIHRHRLDPGVWDYEPGVPVFGSGAQAAAHGIAEIVNPGPEAQRKIDGLLRQKEEREDG